MRKKIMVVGSSEDTGGFRLAGVKYVVDPSSAEDVVRVSAADAVVFITAGAREALGERFGEICARNIVQEIPSGKTGYTRVRDIIRDTLGFDLK